jgi:hypothetical protein
MNALVVNCSHPHYNLGAAKIVNSLVAQGYAVETAKGDPGMFALGYDEVYLSVIFTWHAQIARDIALRVKGNSDVECGGPGVFRLADWWTRETGLKVKRGIDRRFERQPGDYRAVFASRGCPGMGTEEQPDPCTFCIVPAFEGRKFTLNWNFKPAPMLYDNNLSALPVKFQEHIIRRYQETDTRLSDANSGFEPHTFDEGTYERWRPILRGAWRFALDTSKELAEVKRMMRILRDVPASRKRVYVLIGNEPFEACYERARKVIEWGGEPFCQPELPLDWLHDPRGSDIPAAFDWTSQELKDFARYYNRWLWRSMTLAEYKPRKGEPPPFGFMNERAAA